MLRLIGIVVSIGLADSLNPSTIGPALYFGAAERPRRRVLEFTTAVFLVYLAGGVAIALGPGRWLFSLIPHPHHRVAYLIELGIGIGMLAAALMLWKLRGQLARRSNSDFEPTERSSWLLGATITALELPSAFPYFAAIAAVVAGNVGTVREVLLLLIFNVCFISPLLGIVGVLTFPGDRPQRVLSEGRRLLHAHWPTVLAVLGLFAGIVVILLGATGLASARHGHVAREIQRLRHRITHP